MRAVFLWGTMIGQGDGFKGPVWRIWWFPVVEITINEVPHNSPFANGGQKRKNPSLELVFGLSTLDNCRNMADTEEEDLLPL